MKYNPMVYIGKLFDNKKFLVAFSLICAVIFWLVIDIAENPTREVTVSDISVAVTNQTDDNGNELTAIGEYQKRVSVTVSGPGYIVSNVKKDDIKVSVVSYADVNEPDTYVLNLSASVDLTGCNVVKISPSYIKVDYDYYTSAEVPIEIDMMAFQQILPEGFEVYKKSLKYNTQKDDLATLGITGPSRIVGSISKVVATPRVGSEVLPETQSFANVSLVFYDAAGEAVDSSQLVYNNDYYIRAVVHKSAEIKLIPTFNNVPACYSGGKMPKVTVLRKNSVEKSSQAIETVMVRGPIDVVDGLLASGLQLAPVDFMSVKPGSTSFDEVSLMIPEEFKNSIEIIDGTERVTVSLDLTNLKTKTITISPSKISVVAPSGLSVSPVLPNKSISVTICYDRNKHSSSAITSDKFVPKADFSNVTAPSSNESRPITLSASADMFAWAIAVSPSEIKANIK